MIRKTVLITCFLTCLLTGTYAEPVGARSNANISYLKKVLTKLQKQIEIKQLKNAQAQIPPSIKNNIPAVQPSQCPIPDNNAEERCTECGKTHQQAAQFGHPHKPPYVFQAEQKITRTPVLYKQGNQYLFRDMHGHIVPLQIPVNSSESSHTQQHSTSLTIAKYPPHW